MTSSSASRKEYFCPSVSARIFCHASSTNSPITIFPMSCRTPAVKSRGSSGLAILAAQIWDMSATATACSQSSPPFKS